MGIDSYSGDQADGDEATFCRIGGIARIEKKACIWSVLAHIIISYIPYTNVIHANICWYFFGTYCNTYQYVCYVIAMYYGM